MAQSRPTSAAQLPAQARKRAEQLIELYEREAYRTYNLALRITGEEAAAARATESAFLRHVASGSTASEGEQARLDKGTVAAALTEAPRTPPVAGDADPLPRAMAALTPSQRTIIAMLSLDQAPQAIAAAMGAPPHTADGLVTRARESLATELQIDQDFVDQRLREWTWAEPPAGIWESLYPQAHRLLAERETATSPSEKPRKGSRSALAGRLFEGSPRTRRRFTGGFKGRSGVWAFRGAVLAIILVPAAAVALSSGDGDGSVALSAPGAPAGSAAAPGETGDSEDGTTYDALSPKELDQLRLQELDELRQASEQQDDESLSAGERSDAEVRAQELLALARERLAEADRREQQVDAQEQQKPPATDPAATPQPGTGTTPVTGKKKKKRKKGATPPPSTGSISDCLFNPETGTYICPQ